jgi:hypothetical protein
MQGLIMAARILERCDLPIWNEGDDAIYRAAYALQVRLENEYGGWKATGDDLWMLPFLDRAFGTDWAAAVNDNRLWEAGKNTGFPYVIWNVEPLAVESSDDGMSGEVLLAPVSPSPLRGSGRVRFRLAGPSNVELWVADVAGRRVRVLADGLFQAGNHEVEFRSAGLASGIYFVQLAAAGQVRSQKAVVLR